MTAPKPDQPTRIIRVGPADVCESCGVYIANHDVHERFHNDLAEALSLLNQRLDNLAGALRG